MISKELHRDLNEALSNGSLGVSLPFLALESAMFSSYAPHSAGKHSSLHIFLCRLVSPKSKTPL